MNDVEVRRVKFQLRTEAEMFERLERWKDPARLRALAEGLAELRCQIDRQEARLSELRARKADFPEC